MPNPVPANGGLCKGKVATRYVIAILGSIGMGLVYGLKVNLHVAIVSMVNHTRLHELEGNHSRPVRNLTTECEDSTLDVSAKPEDGPFIWPSSVQGIILSAYFWGYLVSQLPGGRLAELFSAKWVMFFSVAINVVCTLLTPLMASLHYGALVVMRIGEGIGGGVTFPAMHVILAHWAPPNERSIMSSIVYAGTALGTVIFMLDSGLTAANLNWESVFYTQGAISALWLVIWGIFVADDPNKMRAISEDERKMIVNSLNLGTGSSNHERKQVPWKAVFTSPPFLAILVAHTCSNWGWYMVLIELPLYMKSVLNFKLNENAFLTALPFLCMWVFSILFSKSLDVLRSKQFISTTTARKTATAIASVCPMICFVSLCYIGCQKAVAVLLMTLAITFIGAMYCAFLSNHIDIAPNFAGTLVALTNTVATIPGIVVPIFVGHLTEKDPSIVSWRIIFWVTVIFYVVEFMIYTLFGSGEEQKWNKLADEPGETQPLK